MEDVRQALHRRDGLIVVTGEAGTGKTLLCRSLLQEVGEAAFVSMVLDPRVAGDDLVAHVLTDFGITRANGPIPMHARRQALSAALQRFLRELIPVNRYAVIIIDEAQHLEPAVLEQLRLLMNFETDEAKLLQVVLVGQPELERRLREPEMQAFDQRVARRCEMQPLSGYEVKRYIDRRLSTAQQLAGSWRGTFTPAAARAVADVSKGVPRVVNLVCDLALEIGQQRQVRVIDPSTVRAAARRLNAKGPARQWRWKTPAAAAAAFTMLAGGAMMWPSGPASAMPPWGQAFRLSQGFGETSPEREAQRLAAGPKWSVTRAGSGTTNGPVMLSAAVAGLPGQQTPDVAGVLPVADGITVTVGSFRSAERAATVMAQVQAFALPAFTRVRAAGWHQVVVGPYVTETEAAAAQRGLAARGFTGSAVAGDSSATLLNGAGSVAPDTRALLLVSADRLSLVLQLPGEPKKVAANTVDGSTLQIDVGPVTTRHRAEQLNPAPGVPVIAQVALQDVEGAGREALLRARVALQGASRNDVRVVGRRVYVDFTPEAGEASSRMAGRPTAAGAEAPALRETLRDTPVRSAGAEAPASDAVKASEVEPIAAASSYDDQIGPLVSRLAEIGPFLLSATKAPAPEILGALRQTLTGVQESLRAIGAPPAAAPSHALLLSAVDQARQSVEPDFSGDRTERARQAIASWTQAAQRKES
ncbi:MAG TPA: AAA family ATPase [Vicinamibacterales bacterium]